MEWYRYQIPFHSEYDAPPDCEKNGNAMIDIWNFNVSWSYSFRLYFAYFLFLFWWNSIVFWSYSLIFSLFFILSWWTNIFWSSSPVFWYYSNDASRRNHRFYEISSFCHFGLTVFFWFFWYLPTVACYDYDSENMN